MGGPTYWEVHEYRGDSPALAFRAGAGEHPEADAHGTRWYVNREEGWRDGSAIRATTRQYVAADGGWNGSLFRETYTVTLHGTWIAPSQEAMFASLRDARALLSGRYREGRLLAHDSDNRRLYQDVILGGRAIFTPVTPTYGEWSMVFLVSNPLLRSEGTRTARLLDATATATGMGFPFGFPMGFNTTQGVDSSTVVMGGNAAIPLRARIFGPTSGFKLIDSATGRSMSMAGTTLDTSDVAILDSATRTFLVNGQNRRWAVTGDWLDLSPGVNRFMFLPGGHGPNTKVEIEYPEEAWL